MPLKELDAAILAVLKSKGILLHTEKHSGLLGLVPEDQFMVMKFCGDALKSNDKLEHQASLMEHLSNSRNIHKLGSNGGALFISPEQGVVDQYPHRFEGRFKRSDNDTEEIIESCVLWVTNYAGLYVHSPCGIATKCGLNLFQVVRSVVNARKTVLEAMRRSQDFLVIRKQTRQQDRVDCYLHVENGKQKTRLIDHEAFLLNQEWLEKEFVQKKKRELGMK